MSRMQSGLVSVKSRAGRAVARLPILAASMLVLLAVVAGCERETELPGDHKLVVIGFDAADWAQVDPLVSAGRMPNMARFLEQGSSTTSMSFVPLRESPEIWASMATGLMPGQHGISDFVRRDGDRVSLT